MGIEQYERSERALLQRIAALEQLCRDLWKSVDKPCAYFDGRWHMAPTVQPLYDRMEALGLLP